MNKTRISALLSVKKKPVLLPFICPSLSQKINILAQFHCSVCSNEDLSFPILTFPIRISAISKQAVTKTPKLRKAFEKAIAHRLRDVGYKYLKGERLCIRVIFVLGKGNRDKDLDNMSKALLDSLQRVLFSNDMDIDHLNLLKINWSEDEDYITINIRKSSLSQHNDVLFKVTHHSWVGAEFLDSANFIESD